MPKMPEAFSAQKREEILDVAQRVALEKPLSHVTMKDIIRGCGVSQGALYHYFTGLDEIWLGLVQRFYQADDLLGNLQQLFLQPLSPQETVCRCLGELCENLRRTIPVYGKLLVEINTLVQANPGIYCALNSPEAPRGRLDEMLQLFVDWCQAQTQAGTVHPRGSLDQLCLYLSSSYLGLRYHAAILQLQPSLCDTGLEDYLRLQLQSWQSSVLYLLGLEPADDATERG